MPNYLNESQRREVELLSRTFTARTDWPTWLLLLSFYSAWAGIIFSGEFMGTVSTVMLLVPLVVLWMSLQHECIHGHPTRRSQINSLIGYLPFAVWYPYTLYRDTHLAHHQEETLTIPGLDPESRYVTERQWFASYKYGRALLWLNKTIGGRLIVGVPLSLWSLLRNDFLTAMTGDRRQLSLWTAHFFWVGIILYLVNSYSAINALEYVFYVSLPALSISLIRSFYEHRPATETCHRTILNESKSPLSWLFLNLNLHLVHHDLPGLPWYYLPRVYYSRREEWIQRSNGFLVHGYIDLFRFHFIKPVDSPRFPSSPKLYDHRRNIAMIRFDNVTKFHKGKDLPAVSGLNLRIEAGELCVFVGPSGCGKTTTLRMINRLDIQDIGTVSVNGISTNEIDVVKLRRGIGFMMQNAALFPHCTVEENISTVPRLLGWDSGAIRDRVAELITLVGLPSEYLSRYPNQLSGGQQSRVALARALASDPPVILMDEPFAALDPVIREHLQDELIALQRRLRKTIILVTHDMNEAIKLGDRIAVFEGQGRLVQFDTPKNILANPKNSFVRQFVGNDSSMKRLALMKVIDLKKHNEPCALQQGLKSSQEVEHPSQQGLKLIINDSQQPDRWKSATQSKAPELVTVSGEDTLHHALLQIINSSTGVVIRVDLQGRYEGYITTNCLYKALNNEYVEASK